MQCRLTLCSLALALTCCGSAPDSTTVTIDKPELSAIQVLDGGTLFNDPVAIYDIATVPVFRDYLAVLISDDPKACDHLKNDTGQQRPYLVDDDGNHLPSFWMRMTDHNPVFPNMRGIGDDLQANWDPGAPAGTDCADSGCPTLWIAATSGSSDMDSSDDASSTGSVAKGDFYVTFAGGTQLSGTFKATACPAMTVQGCSCDVGAGGMMPSMALLGLWALRRRRRS